MCNGGVGRAYLLLCGILAAPEDSSLTPNEIRILNKNNVSGGSTAWLCEWVERHASDISIDQWIALAESNYQRAKNPTLFPREVAVRYAETALFHSDRLSLGEFHRLIRNTPEIVSRSQCGQFALERKMFERVRDTEDIEGLVHGLYAGVFNIVEISGEMNIPQSARLKLMRLVFSHDAFLDALHKKNDMMTAAFEFLNLIFKQPAGVAKALYDVVPELPISHQVELVQAFPNALPFVSLAQFPEHILLDVVYEHQSSIDLIDDSMWTLPLRQVAASRWFEYLQTKRALIAVEVDAALCCYNAKTTERIKRLIPHTYPDEVGVVVMKHYYASSMQLFSISTKSAAINETLAKLIVKNNWVNHPEIGQVHLKHSPDEAVRLSRLCDITSETWDVVVKKSPYLAKHHPSYPDIRETVFNAMLAKHTERTLFAAHPKYRHKDNEPEAYDDWVYTMATEYHTDVSHFDDTFVFSDRTVLALVDLTDHMNPTFIRCQNASVVELVYRPGLIINKNIPHNSARFKIPFHIYIDAMSEEIDELICQSNRQRIKHLKGDLLLEAIKRKPAVITVMNEIDAEVAAKAMPFAKTAPQKRKLMRAMV